MRLHGKLLLNLTVLFVANGGGDNSVTTFGLSTDDDCSDLTGCKNESALNFSADALIEDELKCEYPTSETCEDATAMDSVANGYFGSQKWFSVSFDSAQFVTNSVEGGSSFYTETSLYASCGDTAIDFGVLDAGTYYINVVNTLSNYNGVPFVLNVNSADVVAGCMEQYASNFNADANFDDGSCLYTCDNVWVNLDINTGSYAGELYWELVSDSGLIMATGGPYYSNNTTYSVPLCLQEGSSYTMNSYDSYGDGWNGGTYSISTTCGEDSLAFLYIVANNEGETPNDGEFGDTSSDTYNFESSESFSLISCDEVSPGCTDLNANNYNNLATGNDGSCQYNYGCTDTLAVNFDSLAFIDDGSCSSNGVV